jgi:hypothetical protein
VSACRIMSLSRLVIVLGVARPPSGEFASLVT